jgi:hypothetical protein
MVVVLVVIARAATPAVAAKAVFRANGRAANMGGDCTGWLHGANFRGMAARFVKAKGRRMAALVGCTQE